MNTLLTVVQTLGVLAVLLGVALFLPLALALIVDGVLVVAAGVVTELVLSRRPVS